MRRTSGSTDASSRAAAERQDVSDETVHGAEIARRVPVELLRPQPVGIAAREKRHPRSRPTPRATARLCVQSSMCRAAIERSRRAPHELVGLVRRRSPGRARWSVVGELPARCDSETPTRRMPDSPVRSADSRSARATVRPAIRGRASPACRSSVRERERARDRAASRRGRVAADRRAPRGRPPRRNTGLQRARRRQRSQSSARHRSFGPRNAASVSSTISRMPARIRSSSQGSSVSGSKSSGR